jgi:hypothetical protein
MLIKILLYLETEFCSLQPRKLTSAMTFLACILVIPVRISPGTSIIQRYFMVLFSHFGESPDSTLKYSTAASFYFFFQFIIQQ